MGVVKKCINSKRFLVRPHSIGLGSEHTMYVLCHTPRNASEQSLKHWLRLKTIACYDKVFLMYM